MDVFEMSFSKVFPLLVAKAQRKGRTADEVYAVTRWLTGYSKEELKALETDGSTYGSFLDNAPSMNPDRFKVKGRICGIRIEEIESPRMRDLRILDKLVDDLAKGKPLERVLMLDLRIVNLAERQDLKEQAAAWFSSKWSVPKDAYLESIGESFHSVVPSWYLCLDGERIVSGMGVIDNDFHDRKDLTPNVCAVFTENNYRCLGIAGRLLDHVCDDMAARGIDTLYLLTDHTGFYERYGWHFHCMAQGDGEDRPSRMYIHRSERP